ncbi:MAG: molecular chaperone Tir [Candidatus Cloacimonetes bacterium HGW-Cloacimonetes-3]|jgi:hypothetical protein|nr:MAG: molecular chaperone Tir [Candidatus Cloacimonetes bacterium HGW-Cloacimonetes-3]
MSYRNKTYVAFDADNDMHYYLIMKAWKEHDKIDFDFHNAHDLNNLMETSSEDTIKRRLRERLNNTKSVVLLIGEHTKNLHKFVRWEIETAIEMDIPIICANLNGKKEMDTNLCPPILQKHIALHIKFGMKPIKHSLNEWTFEFISKQRSLGKTGQYHLPEQIYKGFEL